MANVRALDALDQALDLLTLLEVTCAGTDADEAAGMNLVLHEIENRLKDVWEGINTGADKLDLSIEQGHKLADALGITADELAQAIKRANGETADDTTA